MVTLSIYPIPETLTLLSLYYRKRFLNMTKVIYLNSLFSKNKPNKKAIKLIDEAIVKANGINPKAKKVDPMSSKKFIIKHTEDFLNYAIDYSISERINDFLQE